jgi:cytochrome b pre-mRNA-processing protein 3
MLERIGGARRCFRLSQKPAHSNGTSPPTRTEPGLLTSTARTDPQVLGWLKRRLGRDRTARKLYGSIVTQARRPAFYAAWGVPDTPQGRFEMVVLHLALVVRRLTREGADGQRLARALNEHFIVDMDDTMREMTFGDLRVPREIKQVTAALLDRHKAYSEALAEPQASKLQEAITAQLHYLGDSGQFDMVGLADYMRRAASALDPVPGARLLDGNLDWPQPDGGTAS